MCGIAGFEASAANPHAPSVLAESLANRGPDGEWVLSRDSFTLVQTRLSVIDLSDRVQYPMPNESRDVWLLFNGEIYGHGRLRRELERRGHSFATGCDAEVVVHAYEEWGIDGFTRLNGMFAVALLDERRGRLVLARDRFGIKPLVRRLAGPFAFASDALSLVRAGLSAGRIEMGGDRGVRGLPLRAAAADRHRGHRPDRSRHRARQELRWFRGDCSLGGFASLQHRAGGAPGAPRGAGRGLLGRRGATTRGGRGGGRLPVGGVELRAGAVVRRRVGGSSASLHDFIPGLR